MNAPRKQPIYPLAALRPSISPQHTQCILAVKMRSALVHIRILQDFGQAFVNLPEIVMNTTSI